ncbi:MAG: PH domain-containing protein [Gemmatimonadales bacterium]
MTSLDDQLLSGEQIVYRTRPHWILFGGPLLVAIAGVILGVALQVTTQDYWYAGAALVGVALLLAIPPGIRYLSSDFAVTDKRVLARMGIVHRQSLETLLSKVEGLGVEQDLWGRLLGYGTITLTGTGGTRESIAGIPRPLEFRRQVQAQIVAQDDRRLRDPAPALAAAEPRVERECPWCAERILARARICKHCGRDVDPA